MPSLSAFKLKAGEAKKVAFLSEEVIQDLKSVRGISLDDELADPGKPWKSNEGGTGKPWKSNEGGTGKPWNEGEIEDFPTWEKVWAEQEIKKSKQKSKRKRKRKPKKQKPQARPFGDVGGRRILLSL